MIEIIRIRRGLKLETPTDIRPSNLGSRAQRGREREREKGELASYPRAHFYEILKPLNGRTARVIRSWGGERGGGTAQRRSSEEKTRSRISNFAGKSVNPRNRLRRLRRRGEVKSDGERGGGEGWVARDFSQGLNRPWPPWRDLAFFILPVSPPPATPPSPPSLSDQRRGKIAASLAGTYISRVPTCTRPFVRPPVSREVRKSGKRNIARGRGDYGEPRVGKKYTRERRFRVHLSPSAPSRFYLVGACGRILLRSLPPPLLPALRRPLVRGTTRVRNGGVKVS